MIRVAAVADIHLAPDARGSLRPAFAALHDHADVLLLGGDLTRLGRPEEAEVVAHELTDVQVPVVGVLGNHDHHAGQAADVVAVLRDAGVRMLEASATVVEVGGLRLGVAGVKGFGLGFPGAAASDFGEPEMKAFVATARDAATGLRRALASVQDTDVTVALTHYAPVEQTLDGERREIWPFLGCYLLAEAIDDAGADLAVHGHAHGGCERGRTPGGVEVRNVAMPVVRAAYRVYDLMPGRLTPTS